MPSRHHTLVAVASIGLHAAALAVLTALPAPERVHGLETGELIEVVRWSEPSAPATGSAITPATSAVSTPTLPTTEPAPASEPSSTTRPTTKRATPAAPATLATPDEPRVPPPAPEPSASTSTTPGEQPSTRALSLLGMRERSTASTQLPSPRATPGIAGPRPTAPTPTDAPKPAPRDDAVPRTLEDAGFSRDRKGNLVFREPDGHYVAKVLPDGRLHFDDRWATASKKDAYAPRIGGLTDLIRRGQGRERWARDKTLLEKRTFDLRLAMAIAFAEANLARRLKTMYRELLEVWSADLPAENRRLTVFERWDECDETMRVRLPGFEDASDTRIDALRKGAGAQARDTITAFVRRQLPRGSADAYPDDELERLNRRRHSKARFAPYDEPKADTP